MSAHRNTKSTVAMPVPHYLQMVEDWTLISTLMGGTKKMRVAGNTYLPKEEGESETAYDNRLKRTYLFNFFKRTVQALVGKPFSKPITRPEDLDIDIDIMANDVDLAGNDLTMFSKSVFEEGLESGISYILVDYPKVERAADGTVLSVEDERLLNARPYFVLIKAEELIGWKSISVNGVHKLSQVRIKQKVSVPKDAYIDDEVEQIRVINYNPSFEEHPVSFEVHQWDKKAGDYLIVDFGVFEGVSEIPLVPFYADQIGFMKAEAPLLDLAYLNLSHYQKESDYNNIVHITQVPILFVKGWDSKKAPNVQQIGPNRMIVNSNDQSDMKYVEHTGAAAKVGRESVKDLEDQMMKLSIRLLSERSPGGVTATEAVLDTEAAESALKSMVTSLEVTLTNAMKFAYEWYDKEQPEEEVFTVNQEFGLMVGNDMIAQWLLKAQAMGILTKKTTGEEAKKIGYISEEVDIEDEVEQSTEESMKAFEAMQSNMEDAGGDNEDGSNSPSPFGGGDNSGDVNDDDE